MIKSQSVLTKPIYICGPCSAENREQVLCSAKEIAKTGVQWFRAGLWKPRTRPSCFEGVGDSGLSWLTEVKEQYNINVCTEVANPSHVEQCLKHNIDGLWLGARTTSNPFSVEEIAQSLKGVNNITIMIKNPMIADMKLWLGAIERMEKQGIKNILAIHRGFTLADNKPYRQTPLWRIPIELKQERKDLKIICDPSHIAGKREYVREIAEQAANIGFDGLMIETHCSPSSALTDSEQQITPKELENLIFSIHFPENTGSSDKLSALREEINEADNTIIDALAKRMHLSQSIAKIKQEENMTVFQHSRWQEVLNRIISQAQNHSLNDTFVKEIYEIIHQESIKVQNNILKDKKK